jgi:hypothetical protein
LVVARAVTTARLLGAGLGAAACVPEKEAVLALATAGRIVRIVAAVALLVFLFHSVSANRLGARAGPRRAGGARLYLAGARTAIIVSGIAVVAGLGARELAVATDRGAGLSWHATLVTGFDVLAVCRAPVATDDVSVVAVLVNSQYLVPTNPLTNARLPRGWTHIVGLDLAEGVAASILNSIGTDLFARAVTVIASLARVQLAVTAILDVDRACVHGIDTAGGWASAAASATF